MFNLPKRRLRGSLVNVYKHLMEGVKKMKRLFSVVPGGARKGNGYKLGDRKF